MVVVENWREGRSKREIGVVLGFAPESRLAASGGLVPAGWKEEREARECERK